jgi:hypothetical protein
LLETATAIIRVTLLGNFLGVELLWKKLLAVVRQTKERMNGHFRTMKNRSLEQT